jgi:hypothetical protein
MEKRLPSAERSSWRVVSIAGVDGSSRRLHGRCLMFALGRLLTCCAVGALAWTPISASGRDPSWYSDIQYLTWDVRADEAEAARAASSEGEIFLQPSEDTRDCGWYESCGHAESKFTAVGKLPRQMVSALEQMVVQTLSMSRSIYETRRKPRDAGEANIAISSHTEAKPIAVSRPRVR